ncbi:MAG: 50S ribosomal protein L2 [Bdellovibrionaceae bacterium]|nr:50S ribosomal protein L2 [Pseudobdellovibrionaceae bacterium]
MGVRLYKGGKNSPKHRSVLDFSEVTRSHPEKSLVRGLNKKSARNNHGRITVRHHGGRHKRSYRLIDFKRNKLGIPGKVFSIEYDPNRTCYIALIHYKDGAKSYILAPVGLKKDDLVIADDKKPDVQPGNNFPLSLIPTGVSIHNIELRPGKGGQMVRSAGGQAVIAAHLGKYCQLKMPSGESRLVLSTCKASIGQLGNVEQENVIIGKAGRNRWKGKRPSVRGMAMNPIDHPMGGGEGVGKGNHPMTPWGKYCKGLKTRNNKRTNSMIVARRKKRK